MTHQETPPMGAMQASIVPYQIFRAADGMMVIGAPNEGLWQALCRAIGREDLPGDPRFARNELRVKYRDDLIPLIEAAVLLQPRRHWMEVLEREQVPCGPVLTTGEILSQPRLRERGAIVPACGTEVLRSPMRFAGLEPRLDRAPALGEHTEKVLREFK
jgi:crotonobetainyl-CoA:carnitine CoA-transferase CaiB-like acyl-CoA transferase